MAGSNATARELVGPYMGFVLSFSELEAGVIADTDVKHADGNAAGDPPVPWAGFIVGIGVGSVAASNFTIQVSVNSVEDTTTTWTVNSALEYEAIPPANWVPFVAGDTIGVHVVADTVSKDVVVDVYIIVNIGD